MAAKPDPASRSHWYAYEVGGPLQVPRELVSVCPAATVPEIHGVAVFVGAVLTTSDGALSRALKTEGGTAADAPAGSATLSVAAASRQDR